MADDPTAQPTADQPAPDKAPDAKPETDWKAEARKWEQRAKDNGKAAEKLAALEQAQMSEQERLTAQLGEATKAAEQARSEALRFRLAAAHGISDEDAETFLTGSDEDTVKRQAERLVALRTAAAAPGTPRPDLSQGATPLALNDDDGLRKAIFSKLNIGS